MTAKGCPSFQADGGLPSCAVTVDLVCAFIHPSPLLMSACVVAAGLSLDLLVK